MKEQGDGRGGASLSGAASPSLTASSGPGQCSGGGSGVEAGPNPSSLGHAFSRVCPDERVAQQAAGGYTYEQGYTERQDEPSGVHRDNEEEGNGVEEVSYQPSLQHAFSCVGPDERVEQAKAPGVNDGDVHLRREGFEELVRLASEAGGDAARQQAFRAVARRQAAMW